MRIELDHLFVCTAPGAPEAEKLVQFGLHEGPSNQHPGQGTANRRFFFANAMIELIWVSDAREAQSQNTRRTLLWERSVGREDSASPFGICLRRSLLKTSSRLSMDGNMGQRTCRISCRSTSAKGGSRSRYGCISVLCGEFIRTAVHRACHRCS